MGVLPLLLAAALHGTPAPAKAPAAAAVKAPVTAAKTAPGKAPPPAPSSPVSLSGWSPTPAPGTVARPRFTWPNPEQIDQVEIPGIVQSDGIPMKLKVIRVKHRAEEMLQIYAKAFAASGLYIPPPSHQPRLETEYGLVALDVERLVSYTVFIQPNPDGTSTLALGESNLALRERGGQDEVPIYPGAEGKLVSRQEGASLVAYAAKATEQEVLAFYATALGKAGFAPKADDPGTFARGGEQVRVITTPASGGKTGVSVIRGTAR